MTLEGKHDLQKSINNSQKIAAKDEAVES